MSKKVVLRGPYTRDEAVAGGAITPGMLVRRSSATQVVAHSTAGGNNQKMFALENDLVGEGISTAYASGDQVQLGICQRGAKIDALLETGANVAVGDALESNGAGALQAHVKPNTDASALPLEMDSIVGYAREALNNSSGSNARIEIEVA